MINFAVAARSLSARAPMMPRRQSTANCNIHPDYFSEFSIENARKNGELPLKNDDFVLKNGHLFCNSRYAKENLDIFGFKLSAAEVKEINALAKPDSI